MKQSFGAKLKSLFSKSSTINEDFFEELTDMLVEGDIGAKTAFEVVDQLESICDRNFFLKMFVPLILLQRKVVRMSG